MEKIKKFKPRYIIDEKGEKKSVVLSISEYNELLEDIDDLSKVAEKREEYTIPHDDLINQLRKNDFL